MLGPRNAFLVKEPYSKIQISRESNPYGVGNLQICRCGIDFFIGYNRLDYKVEKEEKPYKSKQKCSQIKENNAPGKVYDEAWGIGRKSRRALLVFGISVGVYHPRADTHKYIKDSPDYRKQNGRGR